jgi:hypothetical protein
MIFQFSGAKPGITPGQKEPRFVPQFFLLFCPVFLPFFTAQVSETQTRRPESFPFPELFLDLDLFVFRCLTCSAAEPLSPPVAARKPQTLQIHGHKIEDPYHWLKDREHEDEEVLDYLEDENEYTEGSYHCIHLHRDFSFLAVIVNVLIPSNYDFPYTISFSYSEWQWILFDRNGAGAEI